MSFNVAHREQRSGGAIIVALALILIYSLSDGKFSRYDFLVVVGGCEQQSIMGDPD